MRYKSISEIKNFFDKDLLGVCGGVHVTASAVGMDQPGSLTSFHVRKIIKIIFACFQWNRLFVNQLAGLYVRTFCEIMGALMLDISDF